ncbi:MAG TPA: hypothetical protein VG273_06505 [Bryobacteraceae bacterium]|jgi:hypothetical protein|nr:hypothetical protein [Bryobacteraceae bacterium]
MNRDRLLWIALLAGPIVWLISFLANFALAPLACSKSWKPALFAVSLAAMALTLVLGGLAHRQWQRLGSRIPGEGGDPDTRARAMATAAMASCGFSTLVILAQLLVEGMMGACQ